MGSKVLSLRVPDELAEWADSYAQSRGVTRQELLENAVRDFREDCESGVPELRARIRAVADVARTRPADEGVGDCPKREGRLGHVWSSTKGDPLDPKNPPLRPCKFCGTPGRGPGGFFEKATRDRAELFSRLVAPASVKAWGKAPKDAA